MKIVHHPDNATLVSFAAGSLDESFATVVAAHIASCPTCGATLRDIEAVGGSLLESVSPAMLSPTALKQTLSRLGEIYGDGGGETAKPAQSAPEVPLPLAKLLTGGLDTIAWKTVSPGVAKRSVPISKAAKGSLTLLKIAPGKKIPDHGHNGMEITLVLKGSYRDALGRFGPGDIADLDEHVEHQPVVDSSDPCICIVATEAPTRFKSLFGRLLQPLAGI